MIMRMDCVFQELRAFCCETYSIYLNESIREKPKALGLTFIQEINCRLITELSFWIFNQINYIVLHVARSFQLAQGSSILYTGWEVQPSLTYSMEYLINYIVSVGL